MRKLFLFTLVVSLMVFPTLAQAQGNVKIGELSIQFWPEYDHPDMLVMYSFSLTADSALPAEVQVRIPANANLNAVAKIEAGQMMNAPYDTSAKDGDWVMITLVIDDLSNYRVEYYTPIEKNGATRDYSFAWQSEYAVENLYIQFQQPPSATNIVSTPRLTIAAPTSDGLTYQELSVNGIAAGDDFNLNISYEKGNDALTVSSMPVEVGGGTSNDGTGTSNDGGFSLSDSLPMLLVGVGVLLIVGGLLYFFLAGRNSQPKQERKRHKPSIDSDAAGSNIYCHECGSRARRGDKFCRSCGAKLRL